MAPVTRMVLGLVSVSVVIVVAVAVCLWFVGVDKRVIRWITISAIITRVGFGGVVYHVFLS